MKNKVISGGSIAGGKGRYDRVENDYYATPPYAVRNFLDKMRDDGVELNGNFLEPACGGGHISDVLVDYFGLENVYSYDLVDRGYGRFNGTKDFLVDDFKSFNNVITNPPFKYAEEFARKALSVATNKVILLCKIQFLEGKKRVPLFKETPLKYIYVYSSRVATYRNGEESDGNGKKWSTTMCLAWFVWEHGYDGEPIVRWVK